jgi:glutamate---cysteine ligase / carboxylate-amine ligase
MSEFPTVGVEEEFLLVDPRTGEPAPHNAAVAAEPSAVASHCSWN